MLLRARRIVTVAGAGLLGAIIAVVPASPALAATWTVATTPNPATMDNRFNGVDVVGATDAWAVGSRQAAWNTPTVALAARWNGTTWSTVTTPAVTGAAALHGVDGNAATNVWAVGAAGSATLTQRWNGTAWSTVTSPTPAGSTGATLRGVKTLASNDAWAVGDFSMSSSPIRRTLILRWNGTAWSQVASPNPDGNQNLLVAVDGTASDLWAVGNQGTDGYGGDTVAGLMLRWNGSAWSNVALPGGSGWQTGFSTRKLHDVVVVSSTDVWAVGTAFSFTSFAWVPYFVRWNGQTWQEGTIPNAGTGGFRTVSALSASKVYAFGEEGGQRLIARWNGSAWSRESVPATAGPLADSAALGPSRIWAVGLRYESNGNIRTLAIGTANG